MTSNVAYKNYFMRGESFQREKRGAWVAQYTIVRQEGNGTDFPSLQYQLSHVFRTETEANDFAVQKAQEWIDQNQGPRGVHSAVNR